MHQSQVMRCVLLCVCCQAFELQDTIHALIEENIQLHDQLENLTRALRELQQLLFHHSDGITPETHLLLEHALCGHDLHGSAPLISSGRVDLLLLLTFLMLAHDLL
ncbi:hypothetical protein IRJ41_002363 [Triplophysa rosa]|uniref:Uncharacterized protein n=1 Tax=Triplophysa rosa TaxID=992332 RepID=A0A9W7TGI0_TRIRA|nr:hypothetical protein IRJ41_002363 [Triplophysa rosa]